MQIFTVTFFYLIFKAVYTFSITLLQECTLSEKRYKSCHWGCTYSKGKLLSISGVNMYILGVNMFILGAICTF